MNVAVVGGGISGLTAAERLAGRCQVTLFEAKNRLGGHANTLRINVADKLIDVDTGFIVFNPENYPVFCDLLRRYHITCQDSDMSFSVSNRVTGLEYSTGSLAGLFCQKRNLMRTCFLRMLWDIKRFYREAPALLVDETQQTLADYLTENHYSSGFIEDHILPMVSALWSGDTETILSFPVRYLVAFMLQHKMLQLARRPVWKTITGGSKCYVEAVQDKAAFAIHLGQPVNAICRDAQQITIDQQGQQRAFDYVILACHSDQALSLLADASSQEARILGSISYQENTITLHGDTNVLPHDRHAWASWNVLIDKHSTKRCRVSYWMNRLQSLPTDKPVIVSLNMGTDIQPNKVWRHLSYQHPVYNSQSLIAQAGKTQIQGQNRTYFCGAYWGWGFHEDGARSGMQAADQLLRDTGYA